MNKLFIPLILAACAALLTGCSISSGQTYRQAKAAGALSPQKGKGLVVVYYERGFQASALRFPIYANGRLVAKSFGRGAFCTIDADPCQLHLRVNEGAGSRSREIVSGAITAGPMGAAFASLGHSEDLAVFDVTPGQTYFVNAHMGRWHEEMTLQPADKAEPQAAECHWLNPMTSPPRTGR